MNDENQRLAENALNIVSAKPPMMLLLKRKQLKPRRELTRNLPEMKLCLEWHNLSLLYIWKVDQKPNS